MLTKTIGQLDETSTIAGSDVFEVEVSGVSKKITLDTFAALSSHFVGETVFSDLKKTVSPTFPAINRAITIDVSETNYPLLVSEYRAEQLELLGVSEWQVTVTSSVVTIVAGSTAATALCSLFQQDAIVSSYQNTSEPAAFTNTADYATSSTSRCINLDGTDYRITNASATSTNFSLTSEPGNGTYTLKVYPYRVAGSSTTARLFKISGSALIAAGDAGGEVVGGFRKMDRMQPITGSLSRAASNAFCTAAAVESGALGRSTVSRGVSAGDSGTTGFDITFNSANSPNARTGKTTDPRTAGMNVYTWAGVYLP
jgi:hypothetical protein